MLGTIVNVVAIIAGAVIGILIKKNISEKVSTAVVTSLGVTTFFIGIKGALVGEKTLILVLSVAIGTMIGTIIDIDKYIGKFGEFLKKKFQKIIKDESSLKFVDAFVSASVLFGVGAMAILGSIDAGLKHNYEILFLKSVMDFTCAIMYGSTMGIGVAFSAITIFIVEGTLTICASFLTFLVENEPMMNEITATGNMLLIVLGLNLMGITKIKVANMLPAIILCPILYYFLGQVL